MPERIREISRNELISCLNSKTPVEGLVSFDESHRAYVRIEPIGTHDIANTNIYNYGLLCFSDSEPLWIQNPGTADKSSLDSCVWYAPLSTVNTGLGHLSSLTENSKIPHTIRFIKNNKISPKIYSSGWTGGSRAKIKTYKVTTLSKGIGKNLFVAGIIIDGVGWYQGEISGAKFAMNSAVSAVAAFGGWPGLVIGLIYWGLDFMGVFDTTSVSGPSWYEENPGKQPVDNLRVILPVPYRLENRVSHLHEP